jgi:hypothetical protein
MEKIIWIYLPMLIALIEIFFSLRIGRKKSSIFPWIFTLMIIGLNLSAVYMLIKILNNAWPSYLPHVGIVLSGVLLLIQSASGKRNKS